MSILIGVIKRHGGEYYSATIGVDTLLVVGRVCACTCVCVCDNIAFKLWVSFLSATLSFRTL